MQGKSSLYAFRTRLKHTCNVSSGILCAYLFTSNRILYPLQQTPAVLLIPRQSKRQHPLSLLQSSTQSACILGLALSKCRQCQSNSSFQRSSIQASHFVVPLSFCSSSQPRKYLPPPNTFINCKMVFCVPAQRFHSLLLIN